VAPPRSGVVDEEAEIEQLAHGFVLETSLATIPSKCIIMRAPAAVTAT